VNRLQPDVGAQSLAPLFRELSPLLKALADLFSVFRKPVRALRELFNIGRKPVREFLELFRAGRQAAMSLRRDCDLHDDRFFPASACFPPAANLVAVTNLNAERQRTSRSSALILLRIVSVTSV
jgi:hypothetical protein